MSNSRNETLDALLLMLFGFLCVFLFDGDPDVWDRLHALAMGACK